MGKYEIIINESFVVQYRSAAQKQATTQPTIFLNQTLFICNLLVTFIQITNDK